MAQGRFARLGGQEVLHLRQLHWQAVLWYHLRHSVLVINGERFAPVALTAEDGIAQTVVYLHPSQLVALDVLLGGCYGLLYCQSVQNQIAVRSLFLGRAVAHDSLLGVITLLAHVSTLYQGYDGEVEVACKGIVAAVMGRYGHDGTSTISCQHVLTYPYGITLAGEGIDGIRTREHTCHAVVNLPLALGTALHVGQILLHLGLLSVGGQLLHQFALGCQNHEGYTEHGVGTCGEDGKLLVCIGYLELHLSAFAASYPVLLCLLDRVAPFDGVQSVEQPLCVGAHSQAPLAHLLLLHGVASTHAHSLYHLVVGQHGTQFGAPVHHGFTHEGNAVVHQSLALLLLAHGVPLLGGEGQFLAACSVQSLCSVLLQVLYELLDGLCFLA